MNVSGEQSLASLDRLAGILEERKAQRWSDHDKTRSEGLRYAAASYE